MNGQRQDPSKPAPRLKDEDWLSAQDWRSRHLALKARAARSSARIVFLGDSITEGWPSVGGDAWSRHLAPLGAEAFGLGGDQTQHLLWRLQAGELDGLKPEVFVLLIGVNNFGQQDDTVADVQAGVEAVGEALLRGWPAARLLLLSILPSGESQADPLRQKIRACNRLLESSAAQRGWACFNSDAIFLLPDGRLDPALLPDGLHPGPEGYGAWAQALKPRLNALLVR